MLYAIHYQRGITRILCSFQKYLEFSHFLRTLFLIQLSHFNCNQLNVLWSYNHKLKAVRQQIKWRIIYDSIVSQIVCFESLMFVHLCSIE